MNGLLRMCATAAMLAVASGAIAQATTWAPSKPVRIIVGAPGGILDVVARQIADRLAPALGQPVIVENKVGTGGIVPMEATRTSPPDGHTLTVTTFVEMAINPWLYERLPYDPIKDFAPVIALYSGQILLAAHPSFPANSLADVIRLARASPGRYFYASSGVARPPHVWFERFKATMGVDLVHVPFKGAAPLTQAVLSGEVPLAMEGVPALAPHVKAGKLKALAVTGDQRLVALPDVPTFAEAGVPGIGLTWVGLVAPAATPPQAIERLHREIARIVLMPEVKASMEEAGRVVLATPPEAFAALIRKDHAEWGSIVRQSRLRPE